MGPRSIYSNISSSIRAMKLQKSLQLSKKREKVLGEKKRTEDEEETDMNIEIPGVYLYVRKGTYN